MPRKRRDKPIAFNLWTQAEKAQGWRMFRHRTGEVEIQSAPGREFVLAHDLERGTVVVPKGARIVRSAADLFAWAASKPRVGREKRGEGATVGPVSAEFLAGFVGFNDGRGERLIREYVDNGPSGGPIAARRVSGRTRVWVFDRADLDLWFAEYRGRWDEMMNKYRAMVRAKAAARTKTIRKKTGGGGYKARAAPRK